MKQKILMPFRPYNDGHKHRWIYYTDFPMNKKCGNETLPNSIWSCCCICLVPLSTYQDHIKRIGKEE